MTKAFLHFLLFLLIFAKCADCALKFWKIIKQKMKKIRAVWLASTTFNIYMVFTLCSLSSTPYFNLQGFHSTNKVVFNLLGLPSTWFSLYTVFNLKQKLEKEYTLFESTQYSLYTVLNLHCKILGQVLTWPIPILNHL